MEEVKRNEGDLGSDSSLTTEQVINIVADRPSWQMWAVWIGLMSFMATASNGSYYPAFGGYIPYKQWNCTSVKCEERIKTTTISDISADQGREYLCGDKDAEPLLEGVDFEWNVGGRSTFSMDWNLHCDREWLWTMSGSIGYFGHLVGSLGGNFYDVFGRKYGALIGCIVLFVNNFILLSSPSIGFFLAFRFVWGMALMCAMDAIFVFMLEYTPSKHRAVVNSGYQFFWAIGYIISPMAGYYITSWKWLLVLNSCLVIIPTLCVLIMPDSPGYFLVNKKDEALAKNSLAWLKRLNGHDFDLDRVTLREEGTVVEKRTFLESLLDFITYREMALQTLIQSFMWLVVGFLYYGFTFTWGSFSEGNYYYSYLYPAIAEAVAYVLMTIPLTYLGRRITVSSFYIIASTSFVLALIPTKFPGFISVEQLSCLVGSTFVSAAFGSVYIYTAELAPTSHRGKIMGICHLGSQIGAVCGPQASLLINKWSKPGTLILFAVLAGLAGLLCIRLPESRGVSTPDTAQQIQARRHGKDCGKKSQAYADENCCEAQHADNAI